MINRDLKRIREDLDTVKSALGWDLPFNEQTIFVQLAAAAGGLWCLAGVIQPYQLPRYWHYLAAAALMCLPMIIYLSYATVHKLDLGLESRPWGFQQAVYPLVSITSIYSFFFWAIATDLVSVRFGGSAMVFVLGATYLAMIAGDRSRICSVGWAIGWMLLAVLTLVTDIDGLILMGMMMAIGGLAGAAVMTWQLRSVERLQRAH
jgi:hypothetical protein